MCSSPDFCQISGLTISFLPEELSTVSCAVPVALFYCDCPINTIQCLACLTPWDVAVQHPAWPWPHSIVAYAGTCLFDISRVKKKEKSHFCVGPEEPQGALQSLTSLLCLARAHDMEGIDFRAGQLVTGPGWRDMLYLCLLSSCHYMLLLLFLTFNQSS